MRRCGACSVCWRILAIAGLPLLGPVLPCSGQVPAGRGHAPAWELSLRSGVDVLRRGDALFVRSAFSADQDLVLSVGTGANRQVNFQQARLVRRGAALSEPELGQGVAIHYCGDDSTPWNINGTYIGANHGCSAVREVTSPGHARSAADLGSEWQDEAGNRFVLIRVAAVDKLWFLSTNAGTGAIWKFNTTLRGTRLRRDAPPAVLPIAAPQMQQLRPAIRMARQDYLLDGSDPVPEGTPVHGGYVDVVEQYDIINPGDLLQDIVTHPGQERDPTATHLQGVIRNRIRYRFLPYGAVLVRHEAEALQDFALGYMGFIQTAKLNTGTFTRHDYYIPRTLPFTQEGVAYDFQAVQDFRGKVPAPLNFGTAQENVDPERLPDRFVQLLGTEAAGQVQYQAGYAIGYSISQGVTVPSERARSVNNALMIYTSSKTYPSAVDARRQNPIPAGTTFSCVAYRQYFSPTLCPAATSFYWHAEGDDLIAYADFHRAVEHQALPLPAEAAGKPVVVLDRTDCVTVHESVVSAAGVVTLSVLGNYGFAVLQVVGGGR